MVTFVPSYVWSWIGGDFTSCCKLIKAIYFDELLSNKNQRRRCSSKKGY